MSVQELLVIARETIEKVPLCFAVTVDESGVDANARIVQPSDLSDDWTVGFLTSYGCRKSAELRRTGRLTLAYECDAEGAYVSLMGAVRFVDDIDAKRAQWHEDSDEWFPNGPEDPDVVLVELTTDRIELWSAARAVAPSPRGLSAAVLERGNDGWLVAQT